MTTISEPRTADPIDEGPCCVPSGAPAMSAERAEELSKQFKAIADPNRLRLVSLISSSPENEACVCDLTDPIGLSQPTVSHHLKVLMDAGFLTRSKRGTWAYYKLVPESLAELSTLLTDA